MSTLLDKMPGMAGLLAGAAMQRGQGSKASLPNISYVVENQYVDSDHLKRYLSVISSSQCSAFLPGVYPQVLSFPLQLKLMTAEGFPFKLMGLVHIGNTVEQYRPIPSDVACSIECSFGDIQQHDKGVAFSLETRLLVGNELYWCGIALYLHRTPAAQVAPKGSTSLTEPDRTAQKLFRRHSINVTSGLGRRYAVISGDINPIHMSALSARFFGYKRPIVHGMWSLARAVDLMSPSDTSFRLSADFKKPMQMPSTVCLSTSDSSEIVQFELRSSDDRYLHIIGSFEAGITLDT